MNGLLNGRSALILTLPPAEEVIFTNRNLTLYDPVLYSGVDVMQVDYHKHLGFILDSKMSYSKHIDGKIG